MYSGPTSTCQINLLSFTNQSFYWFYVNVKLCSWISTNQTNKYNLLHSLHILKWYFTLQISLKGLRIFSHHPSSCSWIHVDSWGYTRSGNIFLTSETLLQKIQGRFSADYLIFAHVNVLYVVNLIFMGTQ